MNFNQRFLFIMHVNIHNSIVFYRSHVSTSSGSSYTGYEILTAVTPKMLCPSQLLEVLGAMVLRNIGRFVRNYGTSLLRRQ